MVPSDSESCPPVVPCSREVLACAAAEFECLLAGSATKQMLADYQVMWDQAQVCQPLIWAIALRNPRHLLVSALPSKVSA